MLIFPVRHHSPAAAMQVQRLIREMRPKAVLVEGPCDATPLIPLLLDAATQPSVALYAYRSSGSGRAVYYPFCDYSPEYVALKEGQAVGAKLAFCDLPAAVTLDREESQAVESDYGQFIAALTEAADFDSFESLWEAAFEQAAGRGAPAAYGELLHDFGAKARSFAPDPHDAVREQHMASAALKLVADGVPAEQILLVCGAAHAEPVRMAFEAGAGAGTGGQAEGGAACEELADIPPAELALIPYSFPRLAEQMGYGPGNRAPWYYQQVWELAGDYEQATRLALTNLARRLRARGHTASLAQVIDAHTLALTLSQMRGKQGPGVDELQDAAIACFGQGRAEPVAAALTEILIGDAVGRVTERVGRTPLQAEFYATAQSLSLPILDAPRQVLLHIASVPKEAAQSTFLHRLALLEIPYGTQLEGGIGGSHKLAASDPLAQLSRVREKWQIQWSPATDAALVERTAWGSTLAESGLRILQKRLDEADRIDSGTGVLLSLALCELTDRFGQALERCEALAADSDSFPALARAVYHLDGLLSYGSARRLPVAELTDLAGRLFLRASLHLPAAALGGDDAAEEVRQTLTPLYELVGRTSPVIADPEPFWSAVETVATMEQSHPSLRGLCLVLLQLGGRLTLEELSARLRYWLSTAAEAAENAKLVAGLFALHRGTLVRNRPLIGAVTDFLLELEIEQLVPLLPTLRRTLGSLSPAERAYLSEALASVLGIGTGEARQALKLAETDQALLREADSTVAQVLAEWRERYGIQ